MVVSLGIIITVPQSIRTLLHVILILKVSGARMATDEHTDQEFVVRVKSIGECVHNSDSLASIRYFWRCPGLFLSGAN